MIGNQDANLKVVSPRQFFGGYGNVNFPTAKHRPHLRIEEGVDIRANKADFGFGHWLKVGKTELFMLMPGDAAVRTAGSR
jgi:hypothetical protein